jgi:hypothetical protein
MQVKSAVRYLQNKAFGAFITCGEVKNENKIHHRNYISCFDFAFLRTCVVSPPADSSFCANGNLHARAAADDYANTCA